MDESPEFTNKLTLSPVHPVGFESIFSACFRRGFGASKGAIKTPLGREMEPGRGKTKRKKSLVEHTTSSSRTRACLGDDSEEEATASGTWRQGAARALHELQLLETRGYRTCVRETVPAKRSIFAKKAPALTPPAAAALDTLGIRKLYAHQQQSLDALKRGKHVVVATPTASGKSMVFNAPVMDALVRFKKARALYIMPQKALAQDQLRSLNNMLIHMKEFAATTSPEDQKGKYSHIQGLRVCSYDGDTPAELRAEIRVKSNVLITNPDMLHMAILPHHKMWSTFINNLKYIVIDEAHVYTGVFGSHFALILRRLRRICTVYGNTPNFICCTATIGNPVEHVCRLSGIEEDKWECIAESGAPSGEKHLVLWQPPLTAPKTINGCEEEEVKRKSPVTEAADIVARFIRRGVKTIAFVHVRSLAEILTKRVQDRLKDYPRLQSKIEPYRAGYSPEIRRDVESRFWKGELLCLAATSALELGIDIGDLDATVHVGMPETVNSLWQQAGRSGRREGSESVAVIVTAERPLDQYFLHHPSKLLDRNYEVALVNPKNSHICQMHIAIAAAERPISVGEDSKFIGGEKLEGLVEDLQLDGILVEQALTDVIVHYVPSQYNNAQHFTIRGTDSVGNTGKRINVVDELSGHRIEEIEMARAFVRAHPGAIIMHRSETFVVKSLDVAACTALVTRYNYPHSTFPKENVAVKVNCCMGSKKSACFTAHKGLVTVCHQVVGFSRINVYTEELLEQGVVQTPPQELHTHALWLDIDAATQNQLQCRKLDLYQALCGLRNLCMALLPPMILASSDDMGAHVIGKEETTGRSQLMIYDHYQGGMGMTEKAFSLLTELLQLAQKVVTTCECESGCFACVAAWRTRHLESEQETGTTKQSCKVLLDALLGSWMFDSVQEYQTNQPTTYE